MPSCPRSSPEVNRPSGFYWQISRTFEPVFKAVAAAGLIQPGYQSIGVYFDDPSSTPEDQLRSHAGFIVSADTPVPEGLEVAVIPAGRSYVHRHLGSYTKMMDGWMYLWGEFGKLGETPTGAPYEIYINDCGDVPEADLITDLHIPI
jgi:AraC family transcriptional regulator